MRDTHQRHTSDTQNRHTHQTNNRRTHQTCTTDVHKRHYSADTPTDAIQHTPHSRHHTIDTHNRHTHQRHTTETHIRHSQQTHTSNEQQTRASYAHNRRAQQALLRCKALLTKDTNPVPNVATTMFVSQKMKQHFCNNKAKGSNYISLHIYHFAIIFCVWFKTFIKTYFIAHSSFLFRTNLQFVLDAPCISAFY